MINQLYLENLRTKKSSRGTNTLAAVVMLFAAGCGGSASSVSGTVTVDGKPLVGSETVLVTVMFYPESSGAPAAARLDESGQYVLSTGSQEGLPPGNYLVAISAKEIVGPSNAESTNMRNLAARRFASPKKSGLKVEVKPGSNTFDFNLKSDFKG